ncbi:helix-turn-helix domain-containing protein [Amycolatopsis sp. NPDC059027]|uniref:helix-turn-helix domain-containing protein n=1 Tax=Amycolatopsis sp. NPDC059027 TaxID=3346709 RepID=UPI00366CEB8B
MTFESRRAAFNAQLREIREAAGLSGTELANLLGWHQTKVSKIENGRQTPTDSDVVEWLHACDASESVVEQLRAGLRAVQVAQLTWRRQIREGHRKRQEQGARDARSATVIRGVEFMAVPGLLQTPDYARTIFHTQADLLGVPTSDIEDAVAARMARQQVLYDRSKTIEILFAESALLHPLCTSEALLAQLDRLDSVLRLPNVRIGILAARRRVPHLLPHGFWVFDNEVRFETVTGEQRTVDVDEVALYNKLADRLWTAAVERDEARELIARIAAGLHG